MVAMRHNLILEKHVVQPAEVFGELIKLGVPTQGYQSDLFHDAIWLSTYWRDMEHALRGFSGGSWCFYWTLRDMGTHIGTEYQWTIESPREAGMTVLRQFRISFANAGGQYDSRKLMRIREYQPE